MTFQALARHPVLMYTLILASPALAQDAISDDPAVSARWYLRGEFAKPSILDEVDKSVSARSADPLLLSYSDDSQSGTEALSIKGATFWEIRRNIENQRSLKIAAYTIGVEVDRRAVNGVDTSDTIEFQSGGSWKFEATSPDMFWENSFLSANLGWITNSAFELSVGTADLSYVPSSSKRGFGEVPYAVGNAEMQFEPELKAQYQRIIDDAEVDLYEGETDRVYVGGSIDATLSFVESPLDRLSLVAGYEYMKSFTNDLNDTRLFSLQANWKLSEKSPISVVVSYENGDTPTTVDTEAVSVNLGVAF